MRSSVYFLLALAFMGAHAIFDCGRSELLCKNSGKCDYPTGICVCDDSHEGTDCSVIKSTKDDASVCAANPCKNSAICYKGGDNNVACSCPAEWTGSVCDESRYQLSCDSTSNKMSMTIKPDTDTFSGKIYVKDKLDTCEFTGADGEFSKVDLANSDADCGAITPTNNQLVRVVYVQFIDKLMTRRDEVVTFTCGTGDTLTLSTAKITINAADSDMKEVSKNVGPVDGDVTMNLKKDDTAVSGSVNIGDRLDITIDLTDAGKAKFVAIQIKSCTVNADDVELEQKLIDGKCPFEPEKNLLVMVDSKLMSTSGTAKLLSFRAFKFNGGSGVAILSCDVKLCDKEADCAAIACGDVTGVGLGRKKRESGVEEKTLKQSFKIRDPASIVDALKEIQEQKACYQTWEMTATVVALAVGLLLLLVLCIVLMVKVILNRKAASSYRDDTSETTSTAQLPYLPHLVSNK